MWPSTARRRRGWQFCSHDGRRRMGKGFLLLVCANQSEKKQGGCGGGRPGSLDVAFDEATPQVRFCFVYGPFLILLPVIRRTPQKMTSCNVAAALPAVARVLPCLQCSDAAAARSARCDAAAALLAVQRLVPAVRSCCPL